MPQEERVDEENVNENTKEDKDTDEDRKETEVCSSFIVKY